MVGLNSSTLQLMLEVDLVDVKENFANIPKEDADEFIVLKDDLIGLGQGLFLLPIFRLSGELLGTGSVVLRQVDSHG